MIYWLTGQPGAGKTTLATALANRINAVHLNADYIRATVNSDLGFSVTDRIEHARRLGEMARLLKGQGLTVVVDNFTLDPSIIIFFFSNDSITSKISSFWNVVFNF